MRVELPRRLLRPVTLLLLVALCVVLIHGGRVSAQTPALTGPQTRLIVFADNGMADDEWAALFAALQEEFASPANSARPAASAVLIRGDAMARRQVNHEGIVVYLEGYCTLLPPRPNSGLVVEGALGWVPRVNGRIQPFIHVDCRLLSQMLGRFGMQLSHDRRNAVMGEAIAHVIMHEWIHITTQSAIHADHGISQSQFTMHDLLAEDSELATPKRMRRPIKAPRL